MVLSIVEEGVISGIGGGLGSVDGCAPREVQAAAVPAVSATSAARRLMRLLVMASPSLILRGAVPRCGRGGDDHARAGGDHRRLHRLLGGRRSRRRGRCARDLHALLPVHRHSSTLLSQVRQECTDQELRGWRDRGGDRSHRRSRLRAGAARADRWTHLTRGARDASCARALQEARRAHRDSGSRPSAIPDNFAEKLLCYNRKHRSFEGGGRFVLTIPPRRERG